MGPFPVSPLPGAAPHAPHLLRGLTPTQPNGTQAKVTALTTFLLVPSSCRKAPLFIDCALCADTGVASQRLCQVGIYCSLGTDRTGSTDRGPASEHPLVCRLQGATSGCWGLCEWARQSSLFTPTLTSAHPFLRVWVLGAACCRPNLCRPNLSGAPRHRFAGGGEQLTWACCCLNTGQGSVRADTSL